MTLHAEAIERKQKAPPLTVDGLLRRRASQRPGVTALCDPPNLAALGFGAPKTLSYRETDAAVDALASFFIEAGLEPGDTVVAQLPNLAMAPLTLLGAWRAGLTVAAVPMLWRAEEIAKVCAEVAPKALIGVSSFVGEKRAETLCAVAASQLSVRFVLGFGQDLPDGVASLDEVDCRGADGQRAPDGLSAAPLAGHDHFHRARRRAARGRRPPRGRASRPGRDDRAVALARCGRRDPQSLSFDRARGAFARADGVAGRRRHAGPAHAVRLSAFRQAAARQRRDGDGDAAFHPGRAGQGRRAAPALLPVAAARRGVVDARARRIRAAALLRRNAAAVRCLSARRSRQPGAAPRDALRPHLAADRPHRFRGRRDDRLHRDETRPGARGRGRRAAVARTAGAARARGRCAATRRASSRPGCAPRPSPATAAACASSAMPSCCIMAASPSRRASSTSFIRASPAISMPPVSCCRIPSSASAFSRPSCRRPSEPIALEALHRFLVERQVAPYKFPDRLLVVKQIPRDADGRVLREQILQQV